MYAYNISGGVANISYQSCAQIDSNQQVYEAHIQISRCSIILKAGSHGSQSCFWIGVSTPHQIFPHPLFLFTLYFIIIITIFPFILSKVAYIR